ncbi:MAG TPA: type III pantothenate kinase, partial [bacterium]|nr:type III pantothenate kinase [bacterium]
MLLAIDVGNTNMVIGVFEGKSSKSKARRLLQHWRMETKKERTSDEFGIFFKELFQFAGLAMNEVEA